MPGGGGLFLEIGVARGHESAAEEGCAESEFPGVWPAGGGGVFLDVWTAGGHKSHAGEGSEPNLSIATLAVLPDAII